MEFKEYNGWPNRPTWNIFTVFSSYEESYRKLEEIASSKGWHGVKSWVLLIVDRWQQGYTGGPHSEPAKLLMQDFLSSSVRYVEWTKVYDALRKGQRSIKGDELTKTAFEVMKGADWQDIVSEAESLTDADEMLQDWLEERCLDWIDRATVRKQRGALHTYVSAVLHVWWGAVDWDKVTSAFKGE